MSQSNKLIIEFESYEQVDAILTDSIRNSVRELTIQISDNLNTWVSYGRSPLQSEEEENTPSFRIKQPIDSLPWLGNMPHLESLTLKFLGLPSLPDGIGNLTQLKKLDISFNFIQLSHELEKFKNLNNLEELAVFGLGIEKKQRDTLVNIARKLKIFYTQKHALSMVEKDIN